MIRTRRIFKALKVLGLVILAICISPLAQAAAQSTNIAYIQTQYVNNGGSFPMTGGTYPDNPAFSAFHFYQLPYTQVSAASLAAGGVCGASACDTVLLNAVSGNVSGVGSFYCNVNGLLSAQAKTDLLNFVSSGGKLIIYDSECSPQNYSWLPYPFTTSNPGAYGGTGTVNIVEDNALSSTILADPKYINATILGTDTDAVGDMNVMTTRDPAWCLDMSGTNYLGQTGPTHTYARYGNGLIIYDGFDVDYMSYATPPVSTNGAGNIAKIWLQELQAPFNPTPQAAMPCGVSVVGITLSPLTATNNLSLGQTSHTVTASLKDQTGVPQSGIQVTFSVTAGPNTGASGTCSADPNCNSDANGEVSFTYSSNGTTGTDTIHACYTDNTGQEQCSQDVTKEWTTGAQVCDANGDGDIDRVDLGIILHSRGLLVSPGDPRDADGDGVITPRDAKVCIAQCTRAGCAVQ